MMVETLLAASDSTNGRRADATRQQDARAHGCKTGYRRLLDCLEFRGGHYQPRGGSRVDAARSCQLTKGRSRTAQALPTGRWLGKS